MCCCDYFQLHTDWFGYIQDGISNDKDEKVSLSMIDRCWRFIKYSHKISETYSFGFSQCPCCSQSINKWSELKFFF